MRLGAAWRVISGRLGCVRKLIVGTGLGVAGSIYGTIVVMAVIAAGSRADDTDPWELAVFVAATVLALWVAHFYAHALSENLEAKSRLSWDELSRLARREASVPLARGRARRGASTRRLRSYRGAHRCPSRARDRCRHPRRSRSAVRAPRGPQSPRDPCRGVSQPCAWTTHRRPRGLARPLEIQRTLPHTDAGRARHLGNAPPAPAATGVRRRAQGQPTADTALAERGHCQ